MAVFTTHANRCDVCGHEWLGKPDATHCASSKCRSRKWNAEDDQDRQVASQRTAPLPKENDGRTVREQLRSPIEEAAANPRYVDRIAHAISCRCWTCRPPT
jgi:hypothetical protein